MKVGLLSDGQIQRLHEASLWILATLGVHVPHEEMLRLLAEAGAEVDEHAQIAKLPKKLVLESLAVAGKRFTIYGRDRAKWAEFGVGKRNYNTTAGQAHWVEDDLRRRPATLEDVRRASRLADALPWINIVGAMSDPHDLPPEYRCVFVAAEMLKNTTKPVMFWFHDRASARFILELFAIVAGSQEEAGSFLAEEHTVRHFRRELWFPQLLDRRFFQSWSDDGKKDMAARCREMKDRLLREHTPVTMGDGVRKAVDKLLEDARRHLAP